MHSAHAFLAPFNFSFPVSRFPDGCAVLRLSSYRQAFFSNCFSAIQNPPLYRLSTVMVRCFDDTLRSAQYFTTSVCFFEPSPSASEMAYMINWSSSR